MTPRPHAWELPDPQRQTTGHSVTCAHCGRKRPNLFLAPDPVWEFYVKPQDQDKIICLVCFKTLVDWKDGGAFERSHGKAAGMAFPGFFPLPEGGYSELRNMTSEEKTVFYRWAKQSGYWAWLDAKGAPYL
jgi:hypothetical protein